jgi:tetratricopeptide (TPR) repeat protein
MLYSIIPPILIVLSLVGIIVFLVKKSSKIKGALEKSVKETVGEEDSRSEVAERKNPIWKNIWRAFLFVLEKAASLLKSVFLRLEESFNKFVTKIKNKRMDAAIQEEKKEEDILKKVFEYKKEDSSKKNVPVKNVRLAEENKEKVIRPMVSEKIVSPKSKVEIKSKLEDLLIERVAANPKDIEAYERLGEYYMEIENLTDAKECFKQVLKLSPTNRSVKYKIKRLENLLGE